ncbi:hypothetical protein IT568_10110 [bacterium]|nr:hypothetical protein [bacterium]
MTFIEHLKTFEGRPFVFELEEKDSAAMNFCIGSESPAKQFILKKVDDDCIIAKDKSNLSHIIPFSRILYIITN